MSTKYVIIPVQALGLSCSLPLRIVLGMTKDISGCELINFFVCYCIQRHFQGGPYSSRAQLSTQYGDTERRLI